MAYQFSITNFPNSGGGPYAFYRLKELLKSVGWTVPLSGDGSSGPAGDNWSGEPITNSSAWIVVQHPTFDLQILMQRTGNNNGGNFWFSPGGLYTGGTPTVRATAADEVIGNDGLNFFDSADGVLCLMADDAAPHGFYMLGYTDNFGDIISRFIFDPLVATDPLDQHPYIFHSGSGTTGPAAFTGSSAGTESAATNNTNRCVGTMGNGAFAGTIPALSYSAATIIVAPTNEPRSPFTSKETMWPIVYGRRFGIGGEGYKGVGTIAYWGGSRQANYGETFEGGERIIFGEINVPWDGSLPPNIL